MAKQVKVRLLCNRTGADYQQHYGEIVPVSIAEARRLLADGNGELLKGESLPDEELDETSAGEQGHAVRETTAPAAGDEATAPAAKAKPKRARKR
jgi:hypothetical protein